MIRFGPGPGEANDDDFDSLSLQSPTLGGRNPESPLSPNRPSGPYRVPLPLFPLWLFRVGLSNTSELSLAAPRKVE